MPPRYSETEARAAIAASNSLTEALRRLGMCSTGNGRRILMKYVERWGIPTDHFDPDGARNAALQRSWVGPQPLEEILVADSPVRASRIKERLYASRLKARTCEMCGQGEGWNGRRMALILDHVNGISNDNRIENLRIVCPNCNATLETHCGRNGRVVPRERDCARCGSTFRPKYSSHRYCSRACGQRHTNRRAGARPEARRVERPPYEQLVAEIEATSYLAVGRRYGVSDNAIRKWVGAYEAERAERSGEEVGSEG